MLEVSLRGVSFRYAKSEFEIPPLTLTFPASTHTALIGLPGCGSSTLLRIIAGELVPAAGEVAIGTRVVNAVRRSGRPLLYTTSEIDVPGRWSVRHALVNAVQGRSLDRTDRQHELSLAASKWRLEDLLDRSLGSLASSERASVHAARIELGKPAILVADRLFAQFAATALRDSADQLYRTLRVFGTTVISAPAAFLELGFTDKVVVLETGRCLQEGAAAAVFNHPLTGSAAAATGDVNAIPVVIRGSTVESSIGAWEIDRPPFQGSGVALARPDDFRIAAPGEESHFIFGIEEATFDQGRWMARGLVTGGVVLHVALPRDAQVRKGRILPLRYDAAAFALVEEKESVLPSRVPFGVVPSLSETR